MNNLNKLQQNLNYNFKDIEILKLALTHRSYLNESKNNTSNERLEFLGDAVLELVVSQYLYEKQKDQPEGVLTAARSVIVRTETLAEIAKDLELGEFLYMSHGEEKTGGRTNVSLLANTTEAP
jgi:ribonuclease-3